MEKCGKWEGKTSLQIDPLDGNSFPHLLELGITGDKEAFNSTDKAIAKQSA